MYFVSNGIRAISPPLLDLFQLNVSFPRPLAICWQLPTTLRFFKVKNSVGLDLILDVLTQLNFQLVSGLFWTHKSCLSIPEERSSGMPFLTFFPDKGFSLGSFSHLKQRSEDIGCCILYGL